MDTIGEIIPFAKEMLNQRPNRNMLKIYMLGSTLLELSSGWSERSCQPAEKC
uniref:Uncharacterized protein n=1 Tax=Monopterus albus TaxID=43700 RepID=A0A3Q3R5V2_MONAL